MMSLTKINNQLFVINTSKMGNNSYLLIKQNKMVVIDPSFAGDDIINFAKNKYKLIAIILTHAHFDHIFDCSKLINLWDCPVFLHKEDFLTYKKYNYANLINKELSLFSNNLQYFKGEKLSIEDFNFFVFLTKGHTQGSVCFKYDNFVFTGDTLFYEGYGRTDFPNSSTKELKKSLLFLFNHLDDNDLILPGHGQFACFKEIKKNNQQVIKLLKE